MSWEPPGDWTRIETLETHAAGEPLRIVTGGFPELRGPSILAQRRDAQERWDGLRRALMWEPRGHADMYGAVLVPPVTADGDVGVLFLHNEGWSTMCGHGVIALVTAGLEGGLFEVRERGVVRLDTPAGRVTARPEWERGRVASVVFENVPSFVVERDVLVAVEGLGSVRYDLAFGGAFYAYVRAEEVGLDARLMAGDVERIRDVAMRVKRAVSATREVVHPEGDVGLGFLYGVIVVGKASGVAHSRNVCVFAEGEVDRSPTGTGVSGRVALEVARGAVELGEWVRIESVIGSVFDVRAVREVEVAGVAAVVPEVRGSARVVGRGEWWVDPEDELGAGFLVR